MKKRNIVTSMFALLLANACFADLLTPTLDGDISDWIGASTLYTDDPADGASDVTMDIGRFGIVNDGTKLYVCFEAKAGVLGDSTRMEYATVYVDTDSNASTGTVVGGIGADKAFCLSKRTSSRSEYTKTTDAPLIDGTVDSRPGAATTWTCEYATNGTPTSTATTVEMAVSLSDLGVNLGDTIKVVFRTERSADNNYIDIGAVSTTADQYATYTIVPEPVTSGLLIVGTLAFVLKSRKRRLA